MPAFVWQAQVPPGADEVWVGELAAVGLGSARVEGGDVRVAVGVPEFGLGDLGEGVPGLDDVRVGSCTGRGSGVRFGGEVGGVGGQQQDPAGVDPVGAGEGGAVGLGAAVVEVRDLGVPGAVAEVAFGQSPQRVAALDGDRGVTRGLRRLLRRLDRSRWLRLLTSGW